jgi:hypothetical protein
MPLLNFGCICHLFSTVHPYKKFQTGSDFKQTTAETTYYEAVKNATITNIYTVEWIKVFYFYVCEPPNTNVYRLRVLKLANYTTRNIDDEFRSAVLKRNRIKQSPLAILTNAFRSFPQSLQVNTRTVPPSVHDGFIPNPFPFICHRIIWWYIA